MGHRNRVGVAMGGALLIAALFGWIALSSSAPSALAQDEGGGGFGGGGGGRPRMMPGMGGGASMGVMGSNLYVLRGNVLYKFTAELEVAKKYTFEDAPPGGGAPPKKPSDDEGEGR